MQLHRMHKRKKYVLRPENLLIEPGSKTVKDHMVVVSNGLIEKVVPASVPAGSFQDYALIELPGVTLLPGLIDCHVHMAFDSQNLQRTILEWSTSPQTTWQRLETRMQDFLNAGVIAVRDGGDFFQFGLQAKRKQESNQIIGPKIITTGSALSKRGRYGDFLGLGITSLNEAKAHIDNIVKRGVDQLKVVVSGLVSFKVLGQVGATQFTVEELTPIVNYAHNKGLKVMAHASSDQAISVAVDCGVDSIEHGYFISIESLKKMADKGIAWVPTVAPLGTFVRQRQIPYEGANLDIIQRTYEGQLVSIAKAIDLDVLLGVGTDAGANGVFHGPSYLEELEYYHLAGLSPAQILRAATIHSAQIVGLKGGALKPGNPAGFLGLDGDPTTDLNYLYKVAFVGYI